jgi:hypothetical protein
MTLDISPVLVEKVIFHNPITRTVMGHPFRDVCLCHAATDHDPQQADKLCLFLLFPLQSEYHCSCTVANKSITYVP